MPFVTMQYTQGPTGVFGGMKSTDMLAMGKDLRLLFAAAIPANQESMPFRFSEVDFLPQALPLEAIFDSPVNFVVETFGYDWRVKALDEQAVFVIKRQILYYFRQT